MRYETTVPQTETEVFIRNFNVLMSKLHTTMPGEIVTYEGNRIGAVKPLISRKLADGTFLKLPILQDVPIIFPGGDNFGMTWPLAKGSPVMIHICERSIEDWLQNGKEASPEDLRRFSLTDAIAVPGLYHKGNPYPEANNDDFQILYKDASLIIKKDGTIELNGNTKQFVTFTELQAKLDAYVALLNISLTTTPIIGNGANQPTWTALPTSMDISGSETTTVKTGG